GGGRGVRGLARTVRANQDVHLAGSDGERRAGDDASAVELDPDVGRLEQGRSFDLRLLSRRAHGSDLLLGACGGPGVPRWPSRWRSTAAPRCGLSVDE